MVRLTIHRLFQTFVIACLLILLMPIQLKASTLMDYSTRSAMEYRAIVIDFDSVLPVPHEFRLAIEAAIGQDRAFVLEVDRLTVTALRSAGDWLHVILVPTQVVDSGWEATEGQSEIVEVLAHRDSTSQWDAHVRGSIDFSRLAQNVPHDFIDFSNLLNPPVQALAVDYLFPWTNGQEWYKVGVEGGWHQGNSLDFQPVVRANPAVDFAVLAAAPGTLTEICNDSYTSTLRIAHTDGNTDYAHLAANSIRRDLLGQQVTRGQFLGLLFVNGSFGNGYNTRCGSGTSTHLHFVLPRRDMTINGYNANGIAASAFATRYRSSNPRIDNPPPPPPNPDPRQEGPVGISSPRVQGGKVYLTINVKNYGNAATPRISAYVEGNNSAGQFWRAGEAQPAVIQPGQTVSFVAQHDLWSPGTWTASGIYLWNNDANQYWKPLPANGQNQQFSFSVLESQSCPSVPTDQFCAEYFNNKELAGSPALARNEPAPISGVWGEGSPDLSRVQADQWSARYRGVFNFGAGVYTFSGRSDDGIRIFLDDNPTPIFNDWQPRPYTDFSVDITPGQGQHRVTVEYFENGGAAALQVR